MGVCESGYLSRLLIWRGHAIMQRMPVPAANRKSAQIAKKFNAKQKKYQLRNMHTMVTWTEKYQKTQNQIPDHRTQRYTKKFQIRTRNTPETKKEKNNEKYSLCNFWTILTRSTSWNIMVIKLTLPPEMKSLLFLLNLYPEIQAVIIYNSASAPKENC